jgi:pseudoazurin
MPLMKSHNKFLIITSFLIATFSTNIGFAADVTVDMLNRLDKESNIFEPKIVRVNVGDTVLWKAKDKGHNVEFIKKGVPEGVGKFKSKFNKDVEYTFETPGIYAYWCTPHKNMGMIGFVVVGDDKSNLDAIKKLRFSSKSKKIAPDLINSL